jgi:hypothetical protein
LFILRTNVVSAKPNCIAGIATILGPIPDMRAFGKTSLKDSVHKTNYRCFKSIISASSGQSQRDGQLCIVPKPATREEVFQKDKEKSVPDGWCPFTLNTWVRALAIALYLGIIIALELLQKILDRYDGIAEVSSIAVGQFEATIVPAIVLT